MMTALEIWEKITDKQALILLSLSSTTPKTEKELGVEFKFRGGLRRQIQLLRQAGWLIGGDPEPGWTLQYDRGEQGVAMVAFLLRKYEELYPC